LAKTELHRAAMPPTQDLFL